MNNLDYGVIGNCRTAALISKCGSIDWCCFPDFDSPSVFSRLLDYEKGGHFGINTSGEYVITQRYVAHTNILVTSFESTDAHFEILDFMPRYKTGDIKGYYLPAEIYRLFRLRRGTPRFRIDLQPAPNYARDKVSYSREDQYLKICSEENEKDSLYLYSGMSYEELIEGREVILRQDAFVLLSYNQKLIKIDQNRVDLEYQRTKLYWRNWSNRSKKFADYHPLIERSMLVLKLMSYHRSGAVLAALTTSVPEAIGETRNWDYRFCWLRDASMSIDTLLRVGHEGAAGRFITFIRNILIKKSDSFQIMYGIRGERVLTEETLDHLAGYKNTKPVRIGNAAYHQKQNDSFGYLMDVIYKYYQYFPGTLDDIEDMYEIVKNIMRTVVEDWRNPDKGIWEIRGKEQHFVFSKVMCWVALDRGVYIARMLHDNASADFWEKEAELIREEVFANGWNEDLQTFTQTYTNTDLDSSLLLMEFYGFMEGSDPRYIKTVEAIRDNLQFNGLYFRYKNVDDFGTPTSAFTICTFWMVRALYAIGKTEDAKQLFDELLEYSNHLGLYSEDLDFHTKEQLGNFPQAYSHLALINSAMLFTGEVETSRFIRP
ncbi:MAG: glycoside hydrolase family 15 protein [Paludibacter sp.]|jgi:GH15 family glucan-1,4-alpha-glucosidase|nr:glycoside hydrolase family 15 protein [Paludibacter sp.]